MAEEAFLEKRLQVCGTKQLARVWLSDFSCSKVIRTSPHIHSQEGEGEQQEASPQKGVPTLYLGGKSLTPRFLLLQSYHMMTKCSGLLKNCFVVPLWYRPLTKQPYRGRSSLRCGRVQRDYVQSERP